MKLSRRNFSLRGGFCFWRALPGPDPHRVDPFLDTLQFRHYAVVFSMSRHGEPDYADRWPTPSPRALPRWFCTDNYIRSRSSEKLSSGMRLWHWTLKTLRHLWISRKCTSRCSSRATRFFYHFIDTKTGLRAWELRTFDDRYGILIAHSFCPILLLVGTILKKEIRLSPILCSGGLTGQWAMNGREGIVIGMDT